jgi:hypothetical protein
MFDVGVLSRISDYLKDKFPEHKVSDYEEAAAYLTYLMNTEIIDQVNKQLRKRF